MAIANELQVEAARPRAVPIRFNLVARANIEVVQPIRCCHRAFLLLILTLRCDLELWPRDLYLWPLTLKFCSVPAVPWSNYVPDLSEIGQLQFDIWPYDLEQVSRVMLCSGIVCAKFILSQAIRSRNVTIFWCWHVVTRYDLDLSPVDLESVW